jgi:ketosteroid isomerase-like protein
MSRENVEAAREVLSAVARRERSRLIELTDPEIEWHSFFADLNEYHGHVFRFSGGRLRRFRAFSDPEQALEAVGLRA